MSTDVWLFISKVKCVASICSQHNLIPVRKMCLNCSMNFVATIPTAFSEESIRTSFIWYTVMILLYQTIPTARAKYTYALTGTNPMPCGEILTPHSVVPSLRRLIEVFTVLSSSIAVWPPLHWEITKLKYQHSSLRRRRYFGITSFVALVVACTSSEIRISCSVRRRYG